MGLEVGGLVIHLLRPRLVHYVLRNDEYCDVMAYIGLSALCLYDKNKRRCWVYCFYLVWLFWVCVANLLRRHFMFITSRRLLAGVEFQIKSSDIFR